MLDEAALRRMIGGPDVLREQLLDLVQLSKRPTICIRAVPFSAGTRAGLDSSFHICEMVEPFAPVGYVDTLAGALYVEADTVDRFRSTLDRHRATALSQRTSISFIEAAAKAPTATPYATARTASAALSSSPQLHGPSSSG